MEETSLPRDEVSKGDEKPIPVPPLYADLAHECETLLARSKSTYPHREGRGASREALLREFLEQRLPKTIAIGKGHIQDSHDTTTGEFDIIVYDPLARFIISSGHDDRSVFPVEAVIAAIEVRTKIDRAAVRDTKAKSDELGKLKRYYTPTVLGKHMYCDADMVDLSKGLPANVGSPFDPGFPPVFVALVGFDSIASNTIQEHIRDIELDIEAVLALGKYIASPKGIDRAWDTTNLHVHSLAIFVMMLMGRIQHHIQSTMLFDWDFGRYFDISTT